MERSLALEKFHLSHNTVFVEQILLLLENSPQFLYTHGKRLSFSLYFSIMEVIVCDFKLQNGEQESEISPTSFSIQLIHAKLLSAQDFFHPCKENEALFASTIFSQQVQLLATNLICSRSFVLF